MSGQRVVVMGLGRFGGGVGVAKWLARQGAAVVVTDAASAEQLEASVRQLDGLGITFVFGEHPLDLLDGCTLLVVNPAVNPARSAFVRAARQRQVLCTSEIALFLERCPAQVVGITGSVGKSTTTAMVAAVMQADAGQVPGRVWMGGNIGVSLLGDLVNMTANDVVVLELSSAQLDTKPTFRRPPRLGIITHLMPHHLDRHGDFDAYIQAKLNLLHNGRGTEVALLTPQAHAVLCERGYDLAGCGIAEVRVVEPDATLLGRLAVPGDHQVINATLAREVGRELGLDDVTIHAALHGFKGLPHHLEHVGEHAGVQFLNDSKATTPQATLTALAAVRRPVVLMVGGADHQADFSEFANRACEQARVVVCFGQAGQRLACELRRVHDDNRGLRIRTAQRFQDGLALARRLARQGDAVLFSPGCASYDEFVNYEQRGDRFRSLVNAVD